MILIQIQCIILFLLKLELMEEATLIIGNGGIKNNFGLTHILWILRLIFQ